MTDSPISELSDDPAINDEMIQDVKASETDSEFSRPQFSIWFLLIVTTWIAISFAVGITTHETAALLPLAIGLVTMNLWGYLDWFHRWPGSVLLAASTWILFVVAMFLPTSGLFSSITGYEAFHSVNEAIFDLALTGTGNSGPNTWNELLSIIMLSFMCLANLLMVVSPIWFMRIHFGYSKHTAAAFMLFAPACLQLALFNDGQPAYSGYICWSLSFFCLVNFIRLDRKLYWLFMCSLALQIIMAYYSFAQ